MKQNCGTCPVLNFNMPAIRAYCRSCNMQQQQWQSWILCLPPVSPSAGFRFYTSCCPFQTWDTKSFVLILSFKCKNGMHEIYGDTSFFLAKMWDRELQDEIVLQTTE